jgi:hypothetical protein
MSDELQLQFDVHQSPSAVMDEWRQRPPEALKEGRYELTDESFNSLTWEARYMDWPQKILAVCTFGVALLFRGFMTSVFRLTARFDEDGADTRVTMIGRAHPKTRAALGALVTEHGGPTGPSFGATSS